MSKKLLLTDTITTTDMNATIKENHTPGPWTYGLKRLSDGVDDNGEYINVSTVEDYYEVIGGQGFWDRKNNTLGFGLTGYMSEANAKLLAAAPDLLAACKYALKCLESLDINTGDKGDQAYQSLLLAIEKATK